MRFIYTKPFAIFSACVAIVAILFFFQTRGWLDPIRNLFLEAPRPVVYVVKSLTMPVKNFFSTVYNLKQISRDNVDLSNKVLLLEQDLSQLQQEKRDNEALRRELGFVGSSQMQLVPCTVLSQNPFSLSDFLTLKCGLQDGVQEGQAVVSQGFLVGKVVYVGKNSSSILLATSSKFSTDAKLSNTGAEGIVRGTLGSGIILEQLSQNAQIDKGALVTTAGINEKIPRGLLVGEVGEILSSPNDLFKKVTLISPVDFSNLEFVFAVK